MNNFTNAELDVLGKLSELDLSDRDQLNLLGETGEEGQATADNEVGVLLKAWVSLKKEMYLAFCTNDSKYKELRSAAGALESDTTTIVATLASAVVGGIPMAILMPVAKVLVVAIARIGVNIFCKVNEPNRVIGRLTQREQEVLRTLYAENV